MSKESKKINENLEPVLQALDNFSARSGGQRATVLTCDPETFKNIHSAVRGTFEDAKLNARFENASFATKVQNLQTIEVKAEAEFSLR